MDYKSIAKEYTNNKSSFKNQPWEYLKNKSYYNHNFYKGKYGEIIYAKSDDDNTTEYYFVINGNKYGKLFAYSHCTDGDKLNYWFDKMERT